MSVIFNLNEKKIKFPSNFFENETLSSGELNLDKKESFWNGNSLYTLPKILNKVRDNSSNDTSDLSVIQIKSLSLDKKSTIDLTKTFKKNSSNPFLNVFLFEHGNIFACYIYYSKNFTYPNLNIVG